LNNLGLTSPGGYLPPSSNPLSANTYVSIHAESKEHALAIGVLKMDTEEIKKKNEGTAIENFHFLNDGLWGLTVETK